jgi:hypothetical protein
MLWFARGFASAAAQQPAKGEISEEYHDMNLTYQFVANWSEVGPLKLSAVLIEPRGAPCTVPHHSHMVPTRRTSFVVRAPTSIAGQSEEEDMKKVKPNQDNAKTVRLRHLDIYRRVDFGRPRCQEVGYQSGSYVRTPPTYSCICRRSSPVCGNAVVAAISSFPSCTTR